MNEQYPKEINDRRTSLWPYFKKAKDQKKKAHLKTDKLYIDGGVDFVPPARDAELRIETNQRQLYANRGGSPKTWSKTSN